MTHKKKIRSKTWTLVKGGLYHAEALKLTRKLRTKGYSAMIYPERMGVSPGSLFFNVRLYEVFKRMKKGER